jgi:hypothetical protein
MFRYSRLEYDGERLLRDSFGANHDPLPALKRKYNPGNVSAVIRTFRRLLDRLHVTATLLSRRDPCGSMMVGMLGRVSAS